MDNALIDPLTGIEYSLLHLHGFNTKYEIRDGQETVLVDIRVHFSTHCYTKSREDNDPDHVVLYRERKRDGSIDERVFCERRWNFSHSKNTRIYIIKYIDMHISYIYCGFKKFILSRLLFPDILY